MTVPASDLEFHSTALRDYLISWESPEQRSARGISEEEAAYHLLEHAGYLDRYGAFPSWIVELNRLPPLDRRKLVQAACRYTEQMTWKVRARRLLTTEALSAESLDELEDLLIRRDALETVWTVARSLADEFLAGDTETGRQLAAARCVAAEIDDELIQRPDVVSVAARVLKSLPPPLAVFTELSTGWWWNAEVRTLDAAYQQSIVPIRPLASSKLAPVRFDAEPNYSMAAASQSDQFVDSLLATSGQKLMLRAFLRDASRQVYTLALHPVEESQEATILVNDQEIKALAPPEYFAPQGLLYFFVAKDDHDRLIAPDARRSVVLKGRQS